MTASQGGVRKAHALVDISSVYGSFTYNDSKACT